METIKIKGGSPQGPHPLRYPKKNFRRRFTREVHWD